MVWINILLYQVINFKCLKIQVLIMVTEFNHQGAAAEKTTPQQLNQGVCMDVLKPTKEVREDNKKTNMIFKCIAVVTLTG